MSAAQLETSEHDEALASPLKQQVAERLAAHRARRTRVGRDQVSHQPALLEAVPVPEKVNRIAAAVAERYAHTQSYDAFLAAEAERALQQAQAAAEVAARNARAIAEAQREMLAEMARRAEAEAELRAEAAQRAEAEAARRAELEVVARSVFVETAPEPDTSWFQEEVIQAPPPVAAKPKAPAVRTSSPAAYSVRLYEDVGRSVEPAVQRAKSFEQDLNDYSNEDERMALDEEIAFRQSPTFELERPVTPIPGNLLEFPRQLVATRKARPRYAEGPLREDGSVAHDGAQLRIFEVEATQISASPAMDSVAPEWSSIWLDALKPDVQQEVVEEMEYSVALPPQTAPISRRVMAGLVDGCLVGMGTVVAGATFAYNAAELPSLPVMGIAAAGTLGAFFLMYQMLFFTFSESTPGMRYARIGLCTFGDDNPTRSAMRRRTLATLLALLPLGFGFLWACLDDDRLGWHDRISRMYQRSY